jgi:hypothetical protein
MIRTTSGNKTFSVGMGGSSQTSKVEVLQIIDGNEANGYTCILPIFHEDSNSSLTADVSGGWDLISDDLPDGYGRAWLYRYTSPSSTSDGIVSPDNGVTGRVLVQNSNALTGPIPLLPGACYYVSHTIDVSGSGDIYTAYITRGL